VNNNAAASVPQSASKTKNSAGKLAIFIGTGYRNLERLAM